MTPEPTNLVDLSERLAVKRLVDGRRADPLELALRALDLAQQALDLNDQALEPLRQEQERAGRRG